MLPVSTFLHYSVTAPQAGEYAAVVIDVLRATTTICAALESGADGLIPVDSEESAYETANRLSSAGEALLLGGERGGYKIPGFQFGNSPLDYSSADLPGNTLVHLTTNGTAAIKKMAAADFLYTAGFVNLIATAQALARLEIPVIIVCSGSNGSPCYEDTLCAGALINEMRKIRNLNIDDTSLIATDLYDRNIGNIEVVLREKCEHGRYLASIGFEDDVAFASRLNLFDFAVILKSGVLVKDDAKS
jgi:2-phosphosulfolactate phosphatase